MNVSISGPIMKIKAKEISSSLVDIEEARGLVTLDKAQGAVVCYT